MPSKKKKYNARFPAGRIKKIMQTDEEVGKVAQAVPVIISRTLELFVESLLTKAMEITSAKNAKTLSPSHMKQCILSESRFDFLKELVANLPDVANSDAEEASGPPVTSPSRGNFHSFADDVSPSSRRHSEGTSRTPAVAPVPVPVPVPVPATVMAAPLEDARATSLLSLATNSNRIHANFYKESEEAQEGAVACALPPENSQLNSAMQNMTPFATRYPQINTSYGIDEDYDTT